MKTPTRIFKLHFDQSCFPTVEIDSEVMRVRPGEIIQVIDMAEHNRLVDAHNRMVEINWQLQKLCRQYSDAVEELKKIDAKSEKYLPNPVALMSCEAYFIFQKFLGKAQ